MPRPPTTGFVGQSNNRLTVMEEIGTRLTSYGRHISMLRCLCSCGKEIEIPMSSFARGDYQSCGCLRREAEQLVGKTFGDWLVIERLDSTSVGKSRKGWVLCRCVCGKEKRVVTGNLKSGGSKNCGCKKKGDLRKRRKSNGLASARCMYVGYRNSAKNRELPFELTFDAFLQMTQQDCHYCGIPPNRKYGLYKMSEGVRVERVNGEYTNNGIDRVDSASGYVVENCVPCCWECNRAKADVSEAVFLAWIQRITEFQSKKQEVPVASV